MAAKQLSDGNPDGTQIGQNSSDPIGFFSTTPVAQKAVIATVTTASATTTAYGFASTTQANGVVTAVNGLINTMISYGLIAAS